MPIYADITTFEGSGMSAASWLRYVSPAAIEWVDHESTQTRIDLSQMIVITQPQPFYLTGNDQKYFHLALRASGKVRQVIKI